MADDFGDFTVEVAHKPVAGVTEVEIPEKLANYLAKEAPKALKNPSDYELRINAKDEKTAKHLAAYAKAWGARQDPKLRITKQPNGKSTPENVARLSVVLDADVPQENRPGRRGNGAAS